MSRPLDRLYRLLPGIVRTRDAERGYPLRALLAIIAEQANVVDDDIDRLYDNWFIETCDDWVVPYIGDLVGYRPVADAGEPQPEGTVEGRSANRILTPRREVANTVAFRRRKGTLPVLQELSNDVGGWPARAVEFYRLLAWMQHVRHVHLERGRLVSLRDAKALDRIDGPFDTVAHTVSVRRVVSHRTIGRFDIPSVGVFVWRLKAYSVTGTPAYRLEEEAPQCYTFSILGNNQHLVTKPQPDPGHLAAETMLPAPIGRLAFEEIVRERPRQSRASALYYGEDRSVAVYAPDWPVRGAPQPIPRENVTPANLTDWRYRAPRNTVGDDPVLGRIVFPSGQLPKHGVWVRYHYAFSDDMGGGEYHRALLQPTLANVSRVRTPDLLDTARLAQRLRGKDEPVTAYVRTRLRASTVAAIDALTDGTAPDAALVDALVADLNGLLSDTGFYDRERFKAVTLSDEAERLIALPGLAGPLLVRLNRLLIEAAYSGLVAASYAIYRVGPGAIARLGDALAAWRKEQPRYGIIELTESAVYTDAIDIRLQAAQTLQIRAADRTRPVLRLLDYMPGGSDALGVSGARGSRFVLDGLLITGRGLLASGPDPADTEAMAAGDLCRLVIRHTTLVPGWGLQHNCDPKRPNEASIELINTGVTVEIDHSIIGSIEIIANEVMTEPLDILVRDSIVDATGTELVAIGSQTLPLGFARVSFVRCTVIGEVNVHAIALAENSIFMSVVRVARRQHGCMRFCYVTPVSRTPRRYHCQPDLVIAAVDEADPPPAADERAREEARETARVRPVFTTLRYGSAAYGQLAPDCAEEIVRGADDESSMGAFHDLFEPQRRANVVTRLDEYTPASYEAGILLAD